MKFVFIKVAGFQSVTLEKKKFSCTDIFQRICQTFWKSFYRASQRLILPFHLQAALLNEIYLTAITIFRLISARPLFSLKLKAGVLIERWHLKRQALFQSKQSYLHGISKSNNVGCTSLLFPSSVCRIWALSSKYKTYQVALQIGCPSNRLDCVNTKAMQTL